MVKISLPIRRARISLANALRRRRQVPRYVLMSLGGNSLDCRGKIPWHRRIYANGRTLSTLLRLRYAMRQPLRARVIAARAR